MSSKQNNGYKSGRSFSVNTRRNIAEKKEWTYKLTENLP